MLSQHLKVNRDSFCGHLFSPVEQPGPGFLGVFFFSWFPLSEWFYIKRVIINVGSLQFFIQVRKSVWPSLIFGGLSPPTNLMAHYTHLLKHSRSNILILTLSVPMQSNRTCFCFFFRLLWCLQSLPLSSVGHLKQSGSRTSQFMLEVSQTILVIHKRKELYDSLQSFHWYRNSLRRKQLES